MECGPPGLTTEPDTEWWEEFSCDLSVFKLPGEGGLGGDTGQVSYSFTLQG